MDDVNLLLRLFQKEIRSAYGLSMADLVHLKSWLSEMKNWDVGDVTTFAKEVGSVNAVKEIAVRKESEPGLYK